MRADDPTFSPRQRCRTAGVSHASGHSRRRGDLAPSPKLWEAGVRFTFCQDERTSAFVIGVVHCRAA